VKQNVKKWIDCGSAERCSCVAIGDTSASGCYPSHAACNSAGFITRIPKGINMWCDDCPVYIVAREPDQVRDQKAHLNLLDGSRLGFLHTVSEDFFIQSVDENTFYIKVKYNNTMYYVVKLDNSPHYGYSVIPGMRFHNNLNNNNKYFGHIVLHDITGNQVGCNSYIDYLAQGGDGWKNHFIITPRGDNWKDHIKCKCLC
jgi:hypothetical protein